MEVDISDKVNHWCKIGLLGIGLVIIAIIGISYFYHTDSHYLTIKNAKITGTLVNAPVRAAGTIVELLVEDGQSVEAGQALARVKVKVSPEQLKQLQDAVSAAEARYNEIQTRPAPAMPVISAGSADTAGGGNMAAAQAALDKAARDKAKMDKLFAIGGISAVQHNAAAAAYEAAADAYAAAQSVPEPAAPQAAAVFGTPSNTGELLKLAQLQIKQAKEALAAADKPQYIQIESAVDGTVYFNGFKAGDAVEAGQIAFKVGDINEVWIEAAVSSSDKERLSLGQFVKYNIADYSQENFSGTVYEILDAADESADKIIVRISVPADLQTKIKPGMSVNAKIGV